MGIEAVSFKYGDAEVTVKCGSSDKGTKPLSGLSPSCNELKNVTFEVRVSAYVEIADIKANQSIAPQFHQKASQDAAKQAAINAIGPAARDVISDAVKRLTCPGECSAYMFHGAVPISKIEPGSPTEVDDWGDNTVYCTAVQRWKFYYGCNGDLAKYIDMQKAYTAALEATVSEDDKAKKSIEKVDKAKKVGFVPVPGSGNSKPMYVFHPGLLGEPEVAKLLSAPASLAGTDESGNLFSDMNFAAIAEVLGEGSDMAGRLSSALRKNRQALELAADLLATPDVVEEGYLARPCCC